MPTSARLQKETAMDLPIRKTIRLPDYDYNENGAYFITICTKDRVPCLSEVNNVGDDAHIVPQIILKNHGRIVEKIYKKYPRN